MAGFVTTVLGNEKPENLGFVLPHEHLSMSYEVGFRLPEDNLDNANLPWTLENRGWIWQYPYSHHDNIVVNDKAGHEAILESVQAFQKSGGGAIVDCSTIGFHRKTGFLKELGLKTGVHVIAGTGYYIKDSLPDPLIKKETIETMTDKMVKDILDGCDDAPDINCGLIGEVGCSYPLFEFERKSVIASAHAQEITGCPVNFHPGRNPESPAEILRIFAEAGGRIEKSVISHMERTILTNPDALEFAEDHPGVYLEYDLFGIENSYWQLKKDIDFPSDAQRIRFIEALIQSGFEDRILISHDIDTKIRLEKFGGHGLTHLQRVTIPKMRLIGINEDQIRKITIKNPAQILTRF